MRVLLCVLLMAMAGCRIQVIAPQHVAVVTGDLSFLCLPGEVCEIEVSGYDFEMHFYAVPAPGYSFLYWKNSPDHLCPGFFSNKCVVSTVGADPADADFRAMLESDRLVLLEPVYRRDEAAPGIDWTTVEMGDP